MMCKKTVVCDGLLASRIPGYTSCTYSEKHGYARVEITAFKNGGDRQERPLSEMIARAVGVQHATVKWRSGTLNSASVARSIISTAIRKKGRITSIAERTCQSLGDSVTGVMIRVSGKIYGARHRSVKYVVGRDRKTGHYLNELAGISRLQHVGSQGTTGVVVRLIKVGHIPGIFGANEQGVNARFQLPQL